MCGVMVGGDKVVDAGAWLCGLAGLGAVCSKHALNPLLLLLVLLCCQFFSLCNVLPVSDLSGFVLHWLTVP